MTPLAFMRLFKEFRQPSWSGWRDVLARLTPSTRELYVIAGRGSGKSRICALLACCAASQKHQRAPGETIFCGIFAPDRRQARITFAYVRGLLRSSPTLEKLIVKETRERIELHGDVAIEVLTASKAAPRGRSYALAIVEEAAYLPSEDRAEPDVELLRALRPALARVKGSLLAVVSSPYARRGELWRAYEAGDSDDRIVIAKDTMSLNPTFRLREIARAWETDPTSAASEYGRDGAIAFRSDIESFLSLDAVEACVVPGRHELPPRVHTPNGEPHYFGFLDAAGGSGSDSMTMAIAHLEGDVAVLDLTREVRPPFSPERIVLEFADTLKRFGLREVTADKYAGDWPVEQFAKYGVAVEPSQRSKSQIYLAALPMVMSRQVALLDDTRLVAQLSGLERRAGREGRDSVDHGPGGHDDIANAAAGAIVLALAAEAHGIDLPLNWMEAPVRRPASDVSEADIEQALAGIIALGHDEHPLTAYKSGRLPRSEAEARVRAWRRNGTGSSGPVHWHEPVDAPSLMFSSASTAPAPPSPPTSSRPTKSAKGVIR